MEFNQFGFGSEAADAESGLIPKLNSLREKIQSYKSLLSATFLQEIDQALAASIKLLSQKSAPAFGAQGQAIEGAQGENLKQLIEQFENRQAQAEILGDLIKFLSNLCQRVALFIISGGNCIGWLANGFGEKPGQGKKKINIPLNQNNVINNVFRSYSVYRGSPDQHPENSEILQLMGGITPTEIMAVPLIVKGKVAGIIYLDQGFSNKKIANTTEIEISCKLAGMIIDLLPIKKQYPLPEKQAPIAAQQPSFTTPQSFRPQPSAPPPPRPQPSAPPPPAHEEPRIQEPPSFLETPQPQQPIPPMPKAKAPPEMKEEPAVERNMHEEAKRLARLLVSEIKLYNEAKLATARQGRNIYQQLKEDIERSREMYNQRVSKALRASTNYFDEELVRILANGDPSLLGT
jgi:hypothetical protein